MYSTPLEQALPVPAAICWCSCPSSLDLRCFFSPSLPLSNSLDRDNNLLSKGRPDLHISQFHILINSSCHKSCVVRPHPCPVPVAEQPSFYSSCRSRFADKQIPSPETTANSLLTQSQQRYCTNLSIILSVLCKLSRHLDGLEQFRSNTPRVIAPRLPSSDQATLRSYRKPR